MYLEGNIISFTELGDTYEGIVLENRQDTSLLVLDIYGSIKTIYNKDVISTYANININSANNLLKYYKYHLEQNMCEEIIQTYQIELREIKEKYAAKIGENHHIIRKLDEDKLKVIDNLDVYTYSKINERLAEILDSDERGYEIFTDYKHSLNKVVFNRLYTLAEEGTFDEKLYRQQQEDWSNKAKVQAYKYIKKIDKELNINSSQLEKTTLLIEDRVIFGGALRDLTLERNYNFIPKKISNNKDDIDEVFHEVADFAKSYILEKEEIFPWRRNHKGKVGNNIVPFPWRVKD